MMVMSAFDPPPARVQRGAIARDLPEGRGRGGG
jgi:hypothetical protein